MKHFKKMNPQDFKQLKSFMDAKIPFRKITEVTGRGWNTLHIVKISANIDDYKKKMFDLNSHFPSVLKRREAEKAKKLAQGNKNSSSQEGSVREENVKLTLAPVNEELISVLHEISQEIKMLVKGQQELVEAWKAKPTETKRAFFTNLPHGL